MPVRLTALKVSIRLVLGVTV
ncbi:hypothetical protein CCACVL1_17865 [Corchorus capsularis]|uniref:Uncharacterized protein n=1 Tax=Corchorus capsularis TaxID=210143 RepID=A0A1R3HPJ4_COCAP|nr:hypothetical protein CCACVL1_17865 [Corchorus capsularis]